MDEFLHNDVDRVFHENLTEHEDNPSRKVWSKITRNLDKEDYQIWLHQLRKHFAIGTGLTFIFLLLNFALSDYSPIHSSVVKNQHETTVSVSKPGIILPESFPEIKASNEQYSGMGTETATPTPFHGETEVIHFRYESFIPAFSVYQKENQSLTFRNDIHASTNQHIVKIETRSITQRFSIEPFFIKEFAGYDFVDNDVMGANGKEIEQRERTMFSATLGLFVNYHLDRHWYVQTGLGYSWSTSNIDSAAIYARKAENGTIQFQLNTVSGYSYLHSPSTSTPAIGDSIGTAGTYSYLRYVSIPFVLGYQIPLKRFNASVGAGATFNMLNGAEIETDEYDAHLTRHESQIPLHGLKKTNFGLIVKAEFAYQFNKQWSVSLLSSFKSALGPININSALSAYPYNIGVGLGIVYHFR